MKIKLIFLILVLTSFISCSSDESKIIGNWNIQKFEDDGIEQLNYEIKQTCSFEKDGFMLIMDGDEQYRAKWSINDKTNEIKLDLFELETVLNGKYSFEKDKLIIKGVMEKRFVLLEMKR